MNTPDEFKNELLARVSLARVIGTKLQWDARKSQPAKGDYWACCPFHSEKTPSFHVDDKKGVYYCFGCHEKGNAISFLRNSQNLEFREALETLAGMVGMTVPKYDRKSQEKADLSAIIHTVCDEAARHFQQLLQSRAGEAVRNYLTERGVADRARKRFQIGFAPRGNNNLLVHLRDQGFSEQHMLDAGLVARSDRNGELYDRFRNRLIFPIKSVNGKTIAFGGRAMESDATAKYLNSPETAVFKKGSCLFNHGPARDASRSGEALVVVEGYMDVVALQQAGIETCVAPLGTAITESQLHLMWRISSTPVLALDGDAAGLGAAERLTRIALPLLSPGRSLNFCIMPEGKDPDDVVRQLGADSMRSMVQQAVPLAQFVWQCELRKRNLNTPESQAEFEAALMNSAMAIKHPTVRRYYQKNFRDQLNRRGPASLHSTGPSRRRQHGWQNRIGNAPSLELRRSLLATADPDQHFDQVLRENVVLGICLSVPGVIGDCMDRLESLELSVERNQLMLASLIRHLSVAEQGIDAFQHAVAEDVGHSGIKNILSSKHLRNFMVAGDCGGDHKKRLASARVALIEEIEKLETAIGARNEISYAQHDISEPEGENSTARVAVAVSARELARRGPGILDTGEFMIAANGVRINVDELRKFEAICDGHLDNSDS